MDEATPSIPLQPSTVIAVLAKQAAINAVKAQLRAAYQLQAFSAFRSNAPKRGRTFNQRISSAFTLSFVCRPRLDRRPQLTVTKAQVLPIHTR